MKANKRNGFGGVWPVVQRELREGARRPLNHWLRVGSAFGGMIVFGLVANARNMPATAIGGQLFACIHTLLLVLICCTVPAMTADCIAREKREGTLGLLFLTPLTALGIVTGKAAIQFARTFTAWLAVLPVLVVPVLTGGVGVTDATIAVTIEFSVTAVCLAAGLLASSLVKGAGAAFVLAFGIAVVFVGVLSDLTVTDLPDQGFGAAPVMTGLFFDNDGEFSFPDLKAGVWNAGLNTPHDWLATLTRSVVGTSVLLVIVVIYVAHRIKISWRDKPPSVRQERLAQQYCTPVFRRWFARRTQRTMDWNPIAWLQQYSWKARLGKWGICLVCVVVESIMIRIFRGYWEWERQQAVLLEGLAVLFTFAGVAGFLRQKQSGALELILSTPVSANQFAWGRICGLWAQCLPSALVCCGNSLFIEKISKSANYPLLGVIFGCVFSLPFLTTYFALAVKNVIVATVLTLAALFLASFAAGKLLTFRADSFPHICYSNAEGFIAFFGCYVFLAMLTYFRLWRNLSCRIYSF